jgi:energy-coupling factor transport system permease protein
LPTAMFQGRPILLGQYRPLDSFLHRLDARAKMAPVTLVLILALLTHSFIFYVIALLALILSLLYSGVGSATLIRNFRPILILVFITALYHILFSGRETPTLVEIFGFRLTQGALTVAGYYSLRLVLFIAVAFLITLTSSPSDLADTFTRLVRPLQKIRVPVDDLGLILFMAIRFIPILYEEFVTIRNAQIIRGVRFSGSVFSRLQKTVYIIIPVFVAALQRADELALAIQARGYQGGAKRTFYSHALFGWREWFFTVASSTLVLAVFYLTR